MEGSWFTSSVSGQRQKISAAGAATAAESRLAFVKIQNKKNNGDNKLKILISKTKQRLINHDYAIWKSNYTEI